jgi:hypothetical protein
MMIEEIYSVVEEKYFSSGDFNGMPIYELEKIFDIHSDEFKNSIRQAINDDILTARFDGNPHIMAFSKIPNNNVLNGFDNAEYPGHTCLYPSEHRLSGSEKLSFIAKLLMTWNWLKEQVNSTLELLTCPFWNITETILATHIQQTSFMVRYA